MKILLICSKSSAVVGFRKKLIERLQEYGHDIFAIAFDDEHKDIIKEKNIEFYHIADANRSLNPFKILSLSNRYSKIIKQIKPDLVFTFMLKPNIYGVQGAKKAGITNVYSMVEGAGDVFINDGLKWKIIRKFVCYGYKKAFKTSKKVFFLNNDDKAEFIARGLVGEEKCEIVHGIGVDLERFAHKPVKNYTTFLMIARLLKTKGVIEYCEAARAVKKIHPEAIFNLVGPEGTLKQADIQEYIDDGSINYLGPTKDVRPRIEESSIHVLPSYREGLGLVNAEAGAVGRAIITGNTNGTRDTVEDGYNGFLVPIKNSQAIAEKMIYFLENPSEIDRMGKNARAFAEANFDHNRINKKICEIIGAEQISVPEPTGV